MAKDDYSAIVFKILSYLYGCLKKGQMVDGKILSPYSAIFFVKGEPVSDAYWNGILKLMTEEGLIAGLNFINTWGPDVICLNGTENCRITAAGIHYLEDNSKMRQAYEMLKDAGDLIIPLVSAVLPFGR